MTDVELAALLTLGLLLCGLAGRLRDLHRSDRHRRAERIRDTYMLPYERGRPRR